MKRILQFFFCIYAAFILFLSLLTLPLQAHASENGIGRLNFGGYKTTSNCTAFLTTEGHLVTASHCLNLPTDAQLHFLEGYDRGQWVGHIEILPDWFARDALRDLAVVCRATEPKSAAFPLSSAPLTIGETLEVWGYGAPRSDVLQRIDCPLRRISNDGTLILGCSVSGGTSGAPVLRRQGHRQVAVGVVWGTKAGEAFAARLESSVMTHHCGGAHLK